MLQPENRDKPFIHRRYRDGVIDMAETDRGLLLPGRHALIGFEEDFMGPGPVASGASILGWHEDADGSPTALALVADGHGGVAMCKPGGTSTNNVHYQWATNTTVLEPFTMAAGKRLWLSARFKIEDADQNLLIFGLHEAADDPWATEPNDSFLFRSVSGTPDTLHFAGGTTNSTEKTFALNTMANDTWYTAQAFFDGVSTAKAWVWNDAGALLASGQTDFGSTIIPATPMTVAFGAEAVDTGTDEFNLDFINVYMER